MEIILVEIMRCMPFKYVLPKHYLSEVVCKVMHVVNLRLIVYLKNGVHDKIWFAKNVNYGHWIIFGCKILKQTPKHETCYMDEKLWKCIFISYVQYEFSCSLYDYVEKILIKSHYVMFIEDQTI